MARRSSNEEQDRELNEEEVNPFAGSGLPRSPPREAVVNPFAGTGLRHSPAEQEPPAPAAHAEGDAVVDRGTSPLQGESDTDREEEHSSDDGHVAGAGGNLGGGDESESDDDSDHGGIMPLTEDEIARVAQAFRDLSRGDDADKDIKIPAFEKADATEWLQWRETFERIANLKGWNDDRRKNIIIGKMRGDAVAAVASIDTTLLTSHGVLEAYARKFVTEAGQTYARQKFRMAKQERTEDLTAFHTRLIMLYRQAHPAGNVETTVELVEKFVFGLYNRQVQEYVLDQHPDNMTDALRHANVKMATVHAMSMQHGGGSKGGVFGIEAKTSGSGPKCWKCGEFGHMRRECRRGQGGKWQGGKGRGTGGQGATQDRQGPGKKGNQAGRGASFKKQAANPGTRYIAGIEEGSQENRPEASGGNYHEDDPENYQGRE